MRLLRTTISNGNLEIEEFNDAEIPPYAILSHTWGKEEISLQEINTPEARLKKGYHKIRNCCAKAKAEDFSFVWIDTCCIDKTSSAELYEAINSMYYWYQESGICYAYLEDVSFEKSFSESRFSESRWFTRGWTLQELIAPSKVVFLDKYWTEMDNKVDLQQIVSDCTGIPIGILDGTENLEAFSVAQRMSWAAERQTSRVEDRAYSLMGIFGINMPLIYGEREGAFIRLQEEILRTSDDHSLFAWRSELGNGLLARSPAAFAGSRNIVRCRHFQSPNPPILGSRGVHLEVHFIGVGRGGLGFAILECQESGRDDTLIALYVRDIFMTMQTFTRVLTTRFELVDETSIRKWRYPMRKICVQARHLAHAQKRTPGDSQALHSETFADDFSEIDANPSLEFAYELASRAAWEGDDDKLWILMTRADVERAIKSTALCLDYLKDYTWCRGSDPITERKTPLSLAVERGHPSTVKMLLDRGATAEAIHGSERTLLELAIKSRNKLTARMIVDQAWMMNMSPSDLETVWEKITEEKDPILKEVMDDLFGKMFRETIGTMRRLQ